MCFKNRKHKFTINLHDINQKNQLLLIFKASNNLKNTYKSLNWGFIVSNKKASCGPAGSVDHTRAADHTHAAEMSKNIRNVKCDD